MKSSLPTPRTTTPMLRRHAHLRAILIGFVGLGLPIAAAAQLGPPGPEFWSQSSPGVTEAPEVGDEFGGAVAAGDFNCDGIDDLAIGLPGQSRDGVTQSGLVMVLLGGEGGVTSFDNYIEQGQGGVQDTRENFDRFGEVLASGDFNGDDCDDLAIGIPLENLFRGDTDLVNTGAVSVVYGGIVGLTGTGDTFLTDEQAAGQSPEVGDNFGAALAVGDFDADGFDDLAVGSPGEDLGFPVEVDAGMVHVFYGASTGLVNSGDPIHRFFGGPDGGLSGNVQAGERLGAALAAGDIVLLAGDELVIGSPGRDVGTTTGGGAFVLVSDVDGNQFDTEWSQATTGIPGLAEDHDGFGATLAVGDFDGDGVDEIVVGVPEEDGSGPFVAASGAIQYFDIAESTYDLITQSDLPPESEETGDRFGTTLAVGDFDFDGMDDLAVGSPMENLLSISDAGAVHVLYGERGAGITPTRYQKLLQVIEPEAADNQFGFSLAAGRFDGRPVYSLAIGIPFEDEGADDAGAMNVIYSQALFKDGFESGGTERWQ